MSSLLNSNNQPDIAGPSRTAITTATLRAAHYLLDGVPKVLDDAFARSFAGFADDEELLNALKAMVYSDFPRMRTLFALRNRYAEDELVRTIERGISQYIILGAGLDSFAYRRPDLLRTLDVYEVDHPVSQAWKRARVDLLLFGDFQLQVRTFLASNMQDSSIH
jgi:methyltransferase (TIGR00027 family)